MRRTTRLACVVPVLLALATLAPPAPAGGRVTGDLDRLVSWMTGSFSSEARAQRDTSFFDIRLHAVPIWLERSEGRWLYLEQARGDRLDRPYRQRVYHVSARPDGSFESAVFLLPGPLRFAGAWREPRRLDVLTPDSLTARAGCAVVLRFARGRFTGGTIGKECPSELRGAAYATSEVTVEKERMLTLDRGWDADGRQVWGSTAGPYEFRKVTGR